MATQLAIAAVFVVIPNLIGKVNRWRARSPGSLLMRLKPALPLQPIPPLRAVRGPYQPKEAPLQVRSPPPSQWIVITAIMVFVGYHIAQVRHARDLFTVTGLAADAPTAELRSKIAGMTLAEMGWRDTEANLERLLSRLGSIEGRRRYLLYGPEASLQCDFCKTAIDVSLYSFAWRFPWYLVQAALLVALTVPASLLRGLDHLLSSSWEREASLANATGPKLDVRWHRSGWRSFSLYLVGWLAVARLVTYLGYLNFSLQLGRLDHLFQLHTMGESILLGVLAALLLLYPDLGPDWSLHEQIIISQAQQMIGVGNAIGNARIVAAQRSVLERFPVWQALWSQRWAGPGEGSSNVAADVPSPASSKLQTEQEAQAWRELEQYVSAAQAANVPVEPKLNEARALLAARWSAWQP